MNHWHRIDAAWLSILLATHGLTLTALEYVPWFDDSGGGDTSISTDIGRARLFVDEMRGTGIVTLISVVNWNGAAQRGAPTPWFHDRIDEITHRIGPDRVLLLPINEPDRSAKALEWQDYARGVWPGILVFNGPGGRGDPLLRGAHYVSWNWCQDFTAQSIRTTTARLPTINTTDCTPVLNPGPARARAMARASLTHAAHFLVYDALGPSIDERVVAAIGDEVQHATARPQDE